MDLFLQQTVNAFALGGTYALLALGLGRARHEPGGLHEAVPQVPLDLGQESRVLEEGLHQLRGRFEPAGEVGGIGVCAHDRHL